MDKLLFIDVETSSPDPANPDWSLDPRRNKIDLIGVDRPSSVPELRSQLVIYANEHAYKDLGSDLLISKIPYCGHNFKFDFRTLFHKGFPLNIELYQHDTMLMALAAVTKVPESYIESYEKERRRLNEGYPKGKGYRAAKKHSLKVLAPYFLGVSPFWENPETCNDPEYLKKDVLYTKGLFEHFVPMLKKEGVWEFYNDRLMPWQRMILQAELDGIHVDVKALAELRVEAEANLLTSTKKLRAAWSKVEEEWQHKQTQEIRTRYMQMASAAVAKAKPGKTEEATVEKHAKVVTRYMEMKEKALTKIEPFNYGAPAQILWAFKDVLHYPFTNMEGDETTGASVLQILAAQGKKDIEALLDFKEANKLISSFIDAYPLLMVDGKLNCTFNNSYARTGRTTASDPNLQQVPPIMKRVIVPAEGNSFCSQDLSAIEVMLIAYYTEDERLCRILLNEEDFHGVAAVTFELTPEGVTWEQVKPNFKDIRYAAKQGDLSIFYGSGKRRLYTTLTLNGIKEVRGVSLSEQLCASMVRNFRGVFEESWDFKQMLDAELLGGNYVENLFGRRFKIENPEDVYMKGFNTLIQGSASDLLLQGTCDLLAEMKEKGIWCRLRLLVHDNTVVECRDADAPYVNERLCYHLTKFKLMTKHGQIPLKVEGGYGKTWKS